MLALAAFISTVVIQAPVDVDDRAQVLAFSEDGRHALVESVVAGNVLRYTIVGAGGVELAVDVSDIIATTDVMRPIDRIDDSDCRARADDLERALKNDGFGFRVSVHASTCAMPVRRIVRVTQSSPSPLPPWSPDLALVQREVTGNILGVTFVSDDGPLVVVVINEPAEVIGTRVAVKTFLRKDPRAANKRWADP